MEKVKTYKLINGGRVETSKIYVRDSEWAKKDEGVYIVGINNWIINSKGEFLVQRRALTKKNNPGKWSSTNGLIQVEDTSSSNNSFRETKQILSTSLSCIFRLFKSTSKIVTKISTSKCSLTIWFSFTKNI